MKLSLFDNVLFDEFPRDETTKICIFTQPKYPRVDCTAYNGQVLFYCTEEISNVMCRFKNMPKEMFRFLSERRTRLEGMQHIRIRCIPTGNISLSVMLLIYIGDELHLYTGQCNQFRDVVLNQVVLRNKQKLNDIHVDNTLANFRHSGLLSETCKHVFDIIKKYNKHTIYMQVDIFGYEDILYELALNGIKIQLLQIQRELFDQCNHGHLFDFDGQPQIKVFVNSLREPGYFRTKDYVAQFQKHKIIHIVLAAMEHPKVHTFKESEESNGSIESGESSKSSTSEIKECLFYVPYTPHPTAYDLHFLFQSLEPKRVHPLMHRAFQDDPMSKIPDDILNDGCKIIHIDGDKCVNVNQKDNSSDRSFLEPSEELLDSLAESTVGSFDDFLPENSSRHEDQVTDDQQNSVEYVEVEESTAPHAVEVAIIENSPIEISDDDDYDLGLESNTPLRSEPEEDVQMKEADRDVSNRTEEAQRNKSTPNQSDTHAVLQNDANNNEDIAVGLDHLNNRSQSSVINNAKSPQIMNQTEDLSKGERTSVQTIPCSVNEMDTDSSEIESDDVVVFPE